MANVIIGIHGLGNKPPKDLLQKWWAQAMEEGMRMHKFMPRLPKFEMVYWADLMYDKPLDINETDPESPWFLEEPYVKSPENFKTENHETRKKIVDFLRKEMKKIFLNNDLSLNYSFLTDSIVTRYFQDIQKYYSEESYDIHGEKTRVRDVIRHRLYKVLEKHRDDNIMLIAHSMGSIIAFDVLSFLKPVMSIDSFITIGSPLGLPVIISKIAAEQGHGAGERPKMLTPPGVMSRWYNYSDILDKVAFNYKLSDEFSENSHGVDSIDFLVVNDYEINGERNPHKSYGYLRTYEFSRALNEFAISGRLSLWERFRRRIFR